MTRRRVILAALILLSLVLLACNDPDWGQWQNDVLRRQRHDPHPVTVTPEETER